MQANDPAERLQPPVRMFPSHPVVALVDHWDDRVAAQAQRERAAEVVAVPMRVVDLARDVAGAAVVDVPCTSDEAYFALVINRYDRRLGGFGASDLTRVLGRPVYAVAYDPGAVADAINCGVPVRDRSPSSPVAADLAALADAVSTAGDLPPPRRSTSGSSGVLTAGSGVRRLFQAFQQH